MGFIKKEIIEHLESLGIFQIEFPTPFPQAGNVYAFLIRKKENEYFLFDAGLKWEKNEKIFFDFIDKKQIKTKQITDIYLSHGHVDHYGLAKTISEISGAEVHIHKDDIDKVTGDYNKNYVKETGKYVAFFKRYGLNDEIIDFLINSGKALNYFTNQLDHVKITEEGEKINTENGSYEIIHLPGHTPGSIGLYNSSQKILLSGDSLLAKISPNPIVELGKEGEKDRFKSLPVYLRTLDKMYSLDIDLVIPDHGECITDHKRTIENLKKFYDRRQEKILSVLKDKFLTVFDISVKLFPKHKNQMFLIFSEILGNIDVLEEKGKVIKIDKGDKVLYGSKTNELVINGRRESLL